MKHSFAVLFFTVTMVGCSTSLNYHQRLSEAMWQMVCRIVAQEKLAYSCGSIQPPLIRIELLEEGIMGRFDGDKTIIFTRGVSQAKKRRILFHESIHYLHSELGLIVVPGPAIKICWSENEAWRLEGIYSGLNNSRWWEAYSYCWKWYHSSAKKMGLHGK